MFIHSQWVLLLYCGRPRCPVGCSCDKKERESEEKEKRRKKEREVQIQIHCMGRVFPGLKMNRASHILNVNIVVSPLYRKNVIHYHVKIVV